MARERLQAGESFSDFITRMAEGIRIDPHGLDDALLSHSNMFYEIAQRLALTISRRDAAKDEVKVVEAEVDEIIRDSHAQDEKRATDKAVAAEVTQHKDVIAARKSYQGLEAEVGQLTALKESYLQRSYALSKLCDLYLASYYAKSEGGSTSAGKLGSIKDAQYDATRKRVAQERRNRNERE